VLVAMAELALDRRATVLAFGGGSIGDLAGLAASLFLRGVRFVQVPTSLLAMVDSSVGGKTAINLPTGKNLVGTFWPAAEVLIDPEFVASLPDAEFRSGMGEVLKTAIGLCAELFALLEAQPNRMLAREPATLGRAIELSVRAKIRVVESDLLERGQRRLLNLGHTLGHALEAASGFTEPHGVAVARGLHFALERAVSRGAIDAASARRCRELLRRYGFEATPLPPWRTLESFLRRDKKTDGRLLHVVLPTGIGQSRIEPMPLDEFIGA
jgi:3-dehydroquinate synthase